MPKISVIIPVYCVERYVSKCARSLFEQTLDDIEFLFIDDCSPDKSIEIIKRILDEYPSRKGKVVFHRMEMNSGSAEVRKWGFLNATGEYVINCDSDDWIDKEMLEKMYLLAHADNSDVVICDYFITDGDKLKHKQACHSIEPDRCIRNMMYGKDTMVLWNKMFKTSICQDISFPKYSMGEDFCFVLQFMFRCNTVSYIPKPYYYYRSRAQSMTRINNQPAILKRFSESTGNLEIVLEHIETHEIENNYHNELAALKLYQKNLILPLTKEPCYRSMWNDTYPEIGLSILFDTKVLIKERIKYILGKTGIFHHFKKS